MTWGTGLYVIDSLKLNYFVKQEFSVCKLLAETIAKNSVKACITWKPPSIFAKIIQIVPVFPVVCSKVQIVVRRTATAFGNPGSWSLNLLVHNILMLERAHLFNFPLRCNVVISNNLLDNLNTQVRNLLYQICTIPCTSAHFSWFCRRVCHGAGPGLCRKQRPGTWQISDGGTQC